MAQRYGSKAALVLHLCKPPIGAGFFESSVELGVVVAFPRRAGQQLPVRRRPSGTGGSVSPLRDVSAGTSPLRSSRAGARRRASARGSRRS